MPHQTVSHQTEVRSRYPLIGSQSDSAGAAQACSVQADPVHQDRIGFRTSGQDVGGSHSACTTVRAQKRPPGVIK